MRTEELLNLKRLLDEGAISQEEYEQEKKALLKKDKKEKKKKTGIIIACVIVAFVFIGIIGSNSDSDDNYVEVENNTEVAVEKKPEVKKVPKGFETEFPISVSGRMYDDMINMPTLEISISNKTSKNVNAVQFYFEPTDVYGEKVSGWFVTNKLYTDDFMGAGETIKKSWQMLDQSIKGGTVYVYSVYFEDGTEWGNKDASTSDIKKYGYKFEVKY